jgi:hypothetical protein
MSNSTEHGELQSAEACNFSKKSVEQFAAKVAETLNFRVGGDVEELIRKLGGRMLPATWETADSPASIRVFGQNNFEVRDELMAIDERRRFTLAHELGHYFLHSQQGKRSIQATRSGSGPVEWEANWFAAALLMPEEAFKEKFTTARNIYEIAGIFGVSPAAAQVRAAQLNLAFADE